MTSETNGIIAEHETTSPQTLSLREIASWHDIPEITDKPKIRASVPVLQRGLVWNPAQIELLWDSILRGFPIGALVLSTKIIGQEKEMDAMKRDVTHHLLDGQQRCDAIALGFKNPFRNIGTETDTKKSESILWLDLNPSDDVRSTRGFVVRLTTPSHPWGYTRSDSASPLNAGTIRDALKKIGRDPAADGYQRPRPSELSPQEAVAPVPLAWLLHGSKETDLWASIKNRLECSAKLPWHLPLGAFLENKGGEDQRVKIFQAIKRIQTTRIVALCAPDDLLGSSRQESVSSQDQKNISNIEHLFQRLNQQGTTLDGEELAYSMIKAYWPDLAGPIDQIAKQLPATRLISLGIRAALSNENPERLPTGLGVSGIRTMARKKDEKTDRVYHYIKDDSDGLGHGCSQIETWLRYEKNHNPSGILPVHIGSIAHDSPDIFLLLLTFAKRPKSDWEEAACSDWPKRLQALATVAHWFGRNTGNIANQVYAACADQISLANLRRGLAEASKSGDLRPVHAPEIVEDFLVVPKENMENWNWETPFQVDGTDEARQKFRNKWYEFLEFRKQKELLLYAQRDYIDQRFNYDPSRKDFWKGHNRPWDFDHILASYFLYWQQGPFKRICDQWVGTIGNFRAWPFEDNRSDQAEIALDKLSGEKGELKRLNSFLDADELTGFSGGDKVKWDSDKAYAFVTACRTRMLRIYRTWYESVGVAELVAPVEKFSLRTTDPSKLIEPTIPKTS